MYNANRFYYMKNRYFYNYFYNPNSTTSTCNMKKWDSYLIINQRLKQYFTDSKFDFSRQIKINMLYFTLNYLEEIKKSNLPLDKKIQKSKLLLNDIYVKNVFENFKLPKVNIKLKLVLILIKYRMNFLYSKIFYK